MIKPLRRHSPAVITAQYIQYCFDTQPKAGPYINYSWELITLIYGLCETPIMYPSNIIRH